MAERETARQAQEAQLADLERQMAIMLERVAKAEARSAAIERKGWIEQAAHNARLRDVDDAMAMIDATTIESAEDADRAVLDLAATKPHLVQPCPRAEPRLLGVPGTVATNPDEEMGKALVDAIRHAYNEPRDALA